MLGKFIIKAKKRLDSERLFVKLEGILYAEASSELTLLNRAVSGTEVEAMQVQLWGLFSPKYGKRMPKGDEEDEIIHDR